jgi:hypothetical protein
VHGHYRLPIPMDNGGIETTRLEAFSDGVFAIARSHEAAARITRSYALGPPSYLAATLASTRSAPLGLAINGFLVLMYRFTPCAPLMGSAVTGAGGPRGSAP